MRGRANVFLPPAPRRGKPFDELRDDLRHHGIHLTILGMASDGRLHAKLVGHRDAIRTWLDGCGYHGVPVESERDKGQ